VVCIVTAITLIAACQKRGSENDGNTGAAGKAIGSVVYFEGNVTVNREQIHIGDEIPALAAVVT
jgi:hypothetical protein